MTETPGDWRQEPLHAVFATMPMRHLPRWLRDEDLSPFIAPTITWPPTRSAAHSLWGSGKQLLRMAYETATWFHSHLPAASALPSRIAVPAASNPPSTGHIAVPFNCQTTTQRKWSWKTMHGGFGSTPSLPAPHFRSTSEKARISRRQTTCSCWRACNRS
ncbi:hypothetical protein D9M68_789370 [compost metagenome]